MQFRRACSTMWFVTGDTSSRRDRSARHYLLDGALARRLQPTVTLAAGTLGFPAAMVNILVEDAQHTVTEVGSVHVSTTARGQALNDEVIRTGLPMVVQDAASDSRFAHFPSVGGGSVRTYIGVPLMGRETLPVGVMCVSHSDVKHVDAEQVERLVHFGKVVEDQLDLVRRLKGQRLAGPIPTAELATAIRCGEIVPWYQAVVELSTGRTVGYEALARWVHPCGEVTHPDSFIPLAEDSDLIIDLDLTVMRQAMADLRRWQVLDPTLRMSLNLSSRHFDQPDWITTVTGVVTSAGCGRSRWILSSPKQSTCRSESSMGYSCISCSSAVSGCCWTISARAGLRWSICFGCPPTGSRSTGSCRWHWAPPSGTR